MESMIKEICKDVQSRYPNVEFPEPEVEPLWWGRRPTERVVDRVAVIDQNTETLLCICSNDYKIVRFEETIKLVEDAVKGFPQFGRVNIKPSVIYDGRRLRLSICFPETKIEVKKGDFVNPTIEALSSYDLGWKHSLTFGAFRLICTNGMKVGVNFLKHNHRHIQSLNLKDLQNTLIAGMGKYDVQKDLWNRWISTKVEKEIVPVILSNIPFSEKEEERIKELPETGTGMTLDKWMQAGKLTMWDMNSVLTQFVTHEVKSEVRKVQLEATVNHVLETATFTPNKLILKERKKGENA